MKFAYYPGCSLRATGLEYDESTHAVFGALDVELAELKDWSCCGASSGHSLSHMAAEALPARNIALAQEINLDLLAPCAACFNRLKVADYTLQTDEARRDEIQRAIGFEYSGMTQVRNPLDLIVNEIGLARVSALVKRRLGELRLVSYYGCLLVRPPKVVKFDEPDHPQSMNKLLAALGAEPVDWAYATVCCGGSLSLTRPRIAARLVGDLIAHAREVGAQAMVTACPLCQINLEMRQNGTCPKMPIIYFTELIGLALDLPDTRAWCSKHLIDPRGVVEPWAAPCVTHAVR
jgi:heterodisulfide reductase subunit B2